MTLEERLDAIEGKLTLCISRMEAEWRLVDGFDDRIARIENTAVKLAETEKRLASAALALSVAKVVQLPTWRMALAVICAAVIAGVTVEFSHDAIAARRANVSQVGKP